MWLFAISTNHRHDKHAHMIYTYIYIYYIDVTICSRHRKADKTNQNYQCCMEMNSSQCNF
jgi:hypothetical protein